MTAVTVFIILFTHARLIVLLYPWKKSHNKT